VGRRLLARQLVLLAMPCVEAEAFETEESPKNDSREVESLRMSKNELEFNEFEFMFLSFQRSRNPELPAVHVVATTVIVDEEVEHVVAATALLVLRPGNRGGVPRRTELGLWLPSNAAIGRRAAGVM